MTFSLALGEPTPRIKSTQAGGLAQEVVRRLMGLQWRPLKRLGGASIPTLTPVPADREGSSSGHESTSCSIGTDRTTPERTWSVGEVLERLSVPSECTRVWVIKRGPHRTVYRIADLDGVVYLKHFHPRGWFNWLKHFFRETRAEHEASVACLLHGQGLPVPEILACGVRRRLGSPCESVLVTREVSGAVPLEQWPISLGRLPPRQRAGARQALAVAVGELVGRLHRAGVRHGDLHAGNLLVSSTDDGPPQLTLIDLQAMEVGATRTENSWVSPPAALHLALTGKTSPTDRLRFWRAFQRAASGFGTGESKGDKQPLTGTRPRPGDRSTVDRAGQRRALQRAEQLLTEQTLRGWQRADRAFARGNRHVRRLDAGGHTLRGLATLPESWLAALTANPERLFDPALRVVTFKQTHRCRVVLSRAPELPDPGVICVKGVVPGRAVARWLRRIRWSPVRRAWELGHALLRRGIATPRPLACVDSPGHSAGIGYLVTEALPGTRTGQQLVAEFAQTSPVNRALWPWAERLARQLRRLHACQFDHRDLKLSNVLVAGANCEDCETATGVNAPRMRETHTGPTHRPAASHSSERVVLPAATENVRPRVWLLDLDGIRRWRRLPRGRRVQNLARLHVSLSAQGVDSVSLRVRFLKAYLSGSGENWREWWNWVDNAAHRKRVRNQRRGRPIS